MDTVNITVIKRILDDEGFACELIEALNSLVDEELSKADDEIDFDFVDSCVNAVLNINMLEPSETAYSFLTSDLFLKNRTRFGKHFSTSLKIGLIAAVLIASSFTVNAAVGSITGTSLVDNIASIVSDGTTNGKEETTAEITTVLSETPSASAADKETTTYKAASLKDKSILVSKGGMLKDNRLITCYETFLTDVEPYCHYGYISLPLENEVEFKKAYTKKSEGANAAFDEDGYIEKYCANSVCNENTGQLHDYGEWVQTVSPGCTSLGEKQRFCRVCGNVQSCPVKATGVHHFTVDEIERTSDTADYKLIDGYIKYACSVCGKKEKRVINAAKYIVVDRYEFEYDGKFHRPKVIAVLDSKKRVIPKSHYKVHYFDGEGKGKDIYNLYGVYAELLSDYYAQSVDIRYKFIPDTVKFNAILTGDGTIVPVWEKAKFCENVDRPIYEIQYSESKNFKNAKTIKVYGSSTKTVISNVTKGKTYYVRIRGVADYSRYSTIPKGYWSDIRAITVE